MHQRITVKQPDEEQDRPDPHPVPAADIGITYLQMPQVSMPFLPSCVSVPRERPISYIGIAPRLPNQYRQDAHGRMPEQMEMLMRSECPERRFIMQEAVGPRIARLADEKYTAP